ncbi:hypothetical protein [Oceanobacillus locisalsi]|uniref:Uncharacterized protein n=1 Tax=Oceanobacillus locisalsi TaxID=546107 RepID=A0ABW3NGG3_9BACI
MKTPLKNIKKGDYINLYRFTENERSRGYPYKVTHIEFNSQEKRVIDLILHDELGNKKHYSFLNWDREVETSEVIESDVCPCCGRKLKSAD